MDQLMLELEHLFEEAIEGAKRRERAAFDAISSPNDKRIVLFGAGGLGRLTASHLRAEGLEPLAFADNDPSKLGSRLDGVLVLSPQDAAVRFADSATFVATVWSASARDTMVSRVKQLESLGARAIPFGPLFWKYADRMLPYYCMDLPHRVLESKADARDALALWSDETSRRVFLNHLRFRLFADFGRVSERAPHQIYFPQDLISLSPQETFVDCGAYDGDTVNLFLRLCKGRFARIIAFEPDPSNFSRLQSSISKLPEATRSRIRLYPAAVAAHSGYLELVAHGAGDSHLDHRSASDAIRVETLTLDEVLCNEKPTFLKMDIEGAELEAIRGAASTIRNRRPVMAICAYHLQSHLWDVPLAINAISDGYDFFLRQHEVDGWDLVCYAIPTERLTAQNARLGGSYACECPEYEGRDSCRRPRDSSRRGNGDASEADGRDRRETDPVALDESVRDARF
jgi:FkbM family methyltransferase